LRDWLIRAGGVLVWGRIDLRFRLYVSHNEDARDYSNGRHLRFAVVDLDKGKDYPANFVCMLPLHVESKGKAHSIFRSVFGDERVEMAKKLLIDALRREDDSAVKDEIERRLKLLEPKPFCEKACVSCGKLFLAEPRKGFRQKFCPECFKKKFAGRK
jgi:hypothetical protein